MSKSNPYGTTTYVIYGSHPEEEQQALDFQTEVNTEKPNQVILLEKNSRDAEELLLFYAITETRTPQVLIIGESDTMNYHWSTALPVASEILYRLNQIGD